MATSALPRTVVLPLRDSKSHYCPSPGQVGPARVQLLRASSPFPGLKAGLLSPQQQVPALTVARRAPPEASRAFPGCAMLSGDGVCLFPTV